VVCLILIGFCCTAKILHTVWRLITHYEQAQIKRWRWIFQRVSESFWWIFRRSAVGRRRQSALLLTTTIICHCCLLVISYGQFHCILLILWLIPNMSPPPHPLTAKFHVTVVVVSWSLTSLFSHVTVTIMIRDMVTVTAAKWSVCNMPGQHWWPQMPAVLSHRLSRRLSRAFQR